MQPSKTAIFYLISLIISLFLGCSENQPIEVGELTGKNYVYIINEGTYTWNNGSVSAYAPEAMEIVQNIFEQANGTKIGDVPQSISFYNNHAYICVNNSKKIHAVSLPNFKLISTLPNLISPRYMAINKQGIAYVSDLYDKKITIFDLKTGTRKGEIITGKTTESLILTGKLLIVGNWSFGNTVQFFDTEMQTKIHEIEVGLEPNSMVIDKQNKLWVLCSGGFTNTEFPKLYCINIETFAIEKTLIFANKNSSPTRLCFNNDSSSLMYLNSSVFSYTISTENLPTAPLINGESRNLYGLAVCPFTGEIYVSDAKDFVSKSSIYRYSKEGKLIHNFEAGIGAGGFGFYKVSSE